MIRVVIAEDEALTREALTALLELPEDIEVVADTGRGSSVLGLVDDHQAGLAVLDVHMPGMNGIEVAEQLHRERSGFPVVLLTCDARPGYLRRALKAGVRGVLSKETSICELVSVIRKVHAGGRHFMPELVAEMVAAGENPDGPRGGDPEGGRGRPPAQRHRVSAAPEPGNGPKSHSFGHPQAEGGEQDQRRARRVAGRLDLSRWKRTGHRPAATRPRPRWPGRLNRPGDRFRPSWCRPAAPRAWTRWLRRVS
jgi:DNA-binding NarL/FixJ family response regulator